MIVHETIDVSQKAGSNDAHGAKGNARQVDKLVAFGKGYLARSDDHRPAGVIAREPRNHFHLVQEGGTRQSDSLFDVRLVRYPELDSHGSANVVRRIGYELIDEDVVVDAVADATTKDSDG